MSPLKVKTPSVLVALLGLLVTVGVAQGGHELPVYPSYYPHEVAIETMASERAAELLRDATLHAYLGSGPRFPNGVPASIRAVESLGSFVIVRVSSAHDERSACAIVETIVRDMADKAGFVFHPYPVTPLHGDYLYHADRAEAAKARLLGTPTASPPRNLMVKVSGALADLVHPEWLTTVSEWDAAVEEVDAAELVSGAESK